MAAAVSGARIGRGVRLVDDDEVGGGAQELVAVAVALDEVGADDDVRVALEERLAQAQPALEPGRGRGQHADRVDVELVAHLGLPLVREVWRGEHADALDLAAVEELAREQQRLDGLADADVVGDEQAHRVEAQAHEQRHELVRARLDRDPPEAAEGPGPVAHREAQRLVEQSRGRGIAEVGRGSAGRSWRVGRRRPRRRGRAR